MNQPLSESSIEQSVEAGSVILFDLRQLTRFREERPYVQILSDVGTVRLVLFAFRAGQQLKEHCTSSQLLVQVLRGSVRLSTPGNNTKLQAGMVLQVEANVLHSVTATTDAVMLLTMTPSPTHHDMQHELFANLTPLVSRSDENCKAL